MEKKKKKKKDKPKKKEKKKRKGKAEDKPKPVIPPYVIQLGKLIGNLSIEYEFLPKRPKFHIDVLCWGPVAKVFAANEELIIKCIVFDKKAWVPVTVYHTVPPLEDVELTKLHQHIIKFMFYTAKNKLGKGAKKDKSKVFYLKEEEICIKDRFLLAFEENPNVDVPVETSSKPLELPSKSNMDDVKKDEAIVSKLEFLKDSVHKFKMYKILQKVQNGKEINSKSFAPTCRAVEPETCGEITENLRAFLKFAKGKGKGKKNKKPKKPKKKKKPKKGKKKGKQRPTSMEVLVPGEVFLTEPYYSLFEPSSRGMIPSVYHVFILLTATRVMTDVQRFYNNPVVFKVHKLSNLAVELLQAINITSVYVYMNIPRVSLCKTATKEVANVIRFNESHVHFLKHPCPFEFIEMLRTQGLFVELRGVVKNDKPKAQPSLFGTKTDDYLISEKSKIPAQISDGGAELDYIVLAVACFDLYGLLQQPWCIKMTQPLHNPNSLSGASYCTLFANYEFQDTITVNEVNLRQVKTREVSNALSEEVLISRGTSLKISVTAFMPQAPVLQVLNNILYRRLVMEIYDLEFAAILLVDIIEHNRSVFHDKGIPFNFAHANTRHYKPREGANESSNVEVDDAVTGFLLDNGATCLIYLEGSQLGIITHFWQRVMTCPAKTAAIFFNSQALYQRRVYSEFLKYGGLYVITLKVPLQKILSQIRIHITGNVPTPCWKALKKLDLLLRCQWQKKINEYALYPTSKQLISLDMEWGVAYCTNRTYRSIHLMSMGEQV
ncbi:uncharacterized protein LOC108740271 isoform X2 [Agrilus planipennis]|uniref:Uncharacterized protein LOC108740271 isoform X2 n=1 Tax=Agrilus planipennis TaxID=224129 RepID=A0A1W4XB37_AGRPL|nr:uncharacterized protein LOC108740271 isoform X2 [Agrilus planipennis]